MAKSKGPLGKWAAILMIFWLLLGILPTFAQMFGAGYVPSTEWISKTSTFGLISGLATALLLLWLVLTAEKYKTDNNFGKFCALAGVLLLGFPIGKNIVDVTGPMAIALIAGDETELQFTVVRTDSIGIKGCRSSVEFEGLPFIFNSACGVPSDFRDSLTPGTHIVAIGRGTNLGVFVRHLRRTD